MNSRESSAPKMLSEIKEYVLSDYQRLNTNTPLDFIKHDVCHQSRDYSHTRPYEQGGMPMQDFENVMKSDAELQIHMLGLLSDRLDSIVKINDHRKVYRQTIGSLVRRKQLTSLICRSTLSLASREIGRPSLLRNMLIAY